MMFENKASFYRTFDTDFMFERKSLSSVKTFHAISTKTIMDSLCLRVLPITISAAFSVWAL